MTQTVFCLLLPGFDEAFAAQALTSVAEAGHKMAFAGLKAGCVTGRYGMRVLTEGDLGLPLAAGVPITLIIPSCPASHSLLLTEPRLHRLIREVVVAGGQLLTAAPVAAMLARVGIVAAGDASINVVADAVSLAKHMN